jgi:hypothetical protein
LDITEHLVLLLDVAGHDGRDTMISSPLDEMPKHYVPLEKVDLT